MWTDINIDFARKNIRHCCKSRRDYPISVKEINQLKEKVFDHNFVTTNAKTTMVKDNKLPMVCMDCKLYEPNSIRHVWNVWDDNFIEHKKDKLMQMNATNYIEFDLGNQCDLACVYCGPWSSTVWAKELNSKKYQKENDKEWKELILKHLKEYLKTIDPTTQLTFNILGGEPTLIPETYDIIDALAEMCSHFTINPTIMVTTNLNTKHKLMDRFIQVVESTSDIFDWHISISIEDLGKNAELIRYGLNWERFEQNILRIKDFAKRVYLTMTFNLLSFPNFKGFIEWAMNLLDKQDYDTKWVFSMNSVQDGFSDVAFLRKNQVNVDAFIKFINSLNLPSKEPIISHLKNLKNRLGTKDIDEEFFKFWDTLIKRRNIEQIYEQFPHLQALMVEAEKTVEIK